MYSTPFSKPTKLKHVGTFEVKDGTFVISDPCYSLGTWCAGDIENVKKGTWNAYVFHGQTDWGVRCWELVALHSEYPESLAANLKEDANIDVGVDSGQAGIYDMSAFHGGEDNYGDEGWYDLCCRTTLDTEFSAGVIPGGCVSSSGFGDGGYACFVARDGTAEVIGTKIVFIVEAEPDESE